jgi:hypothetical protein
MATKKYADPRYYESKLGRVLDRLGSTEYNYNFDRHVAWVEFRYKDNLYRFDHSVKKAKEKGQDLTFGSDAFAQVVLALEDLTRIVERGIYDLSTWVAGMKYLPEPIQIPECFRILGFQSMPESRSDIESRYKSLAKKYHPDLGGSQSDFQAVKKASEQALSHFDSLPQVEVEG